MGEGRQPGEEPTQSSSRLVVGHAFQPDLIAMGDGHHVRATGAMG